MKTIKLPIISVIFFLSTCLLGYLWITERNKTAAEFTQKQEELKVQIEENSQLAALITDTVSYYEELVNEASILSDIYKERYESATKQLASIQPTAMPCNETYNALLDRLPEAEDNNEYPLSCNQVKAAYNSEIQLVSAKNVLTRCAHYARNLEVENALLDTSYNKLKSKELVLESSVDEQEALIKSLSKQNAKLEKTEKRNGRIAVGLGVVLAIVILL